MNYKGKVFAFITLSFFSLMLIYSCEKQKVTFKQNPAPSGVLVGCEECHNNTYDQHSTNGHMKHVGRYNYACTTCHYNYGMGGSWEGEHPDGEIDINFDPNGLATRFGLDTTVTPTFDPATKTCSNVYCHSNGVTADRGHDSTDTWSTATPPFGTVVYTQTPNWETGKITSCTMCHNGLGNMDSPFLISRPHTMAQSDYPVSGKHQASMHNSNTQDFSDSIIYSTPIWDGVQCFWCHSVSATDVASINGPILQGTYGTTYHVDGKTYFKPRNISDGGTMANGLSYSGNGSAAHCGVGKKCW